MTSSYIDDEIGGADFNSSQDLLTRHVRKYAGYGRYIASSSQSPIDDETVAPRSFLLILRESLLWHLLCPFAKRPLLAQARVASNTIPVIEDKHHTIYQERVDLLTGQVVARMDKRERNKLAKAA
jgi:hypothetical protein